jgi:hypothetical protein
MIAPFKLAVSMALAVIGVSQAQQIDHKALAKQAWSDRAARLSECTLEWEQESSIPKGGMGDSIGLKAADDTPLPRVDLSYTERFSLSLKGDSFRFECNGSNFTPSKETLEPVKYTAVFDGTSGIEYRDQPGASINTGTRTNNGGAAALRRTDTLPILWACRPTSRLYQTIDLDRYEATNRSAPINGRQCVEFAAAFQGGQVNWSIWVDPQASYLIVRALCINQTAIAQYRSTRYDMEYKPSESGELLLARWTIINQGRSMPVSQKTVSVVHKAAIGGTVAKSAFETVAPPRSVIDERDGDAYRRVVVHPDGTQREVSAGETNQVYLEAAGVVPPAGTVKRRISGFLLVAGIILTTALAYLLWRRIRAPRTPFREGPAKIV